MALVSLIEIKPTVSPISFGKKIQICYRVSDRKNKDDQHMKRFRIFRAYNKGKKAISLQFHGIRLHGTKDNFIINAKSELKDFDFLPYGAVTRGYEFEDDDIILMLKLKKEKDGRYMPPVVDVAFIEPNGKLYIQKVQL